VQLNGYPWTKFHVIFQENPCDENYLLGAIEWVSLDKVSWDNPMSSRKNGRSYLGGVRDIREIWRSDGNERRDVQRIGKRWSLIQYSNHSFSALGMALWALREALC
jgi:hypothetical protein